MEFPMIYQNSVVFILCFSTSDIYLSMYDSSRKNYLWMMLFEKEVLFLPPPSPPSFVQDVSCSWCGCSGANYVWDAVPHRIQSHKGLRLTVATCVPHNLTGMEFFFMILSSNLTFMESHVFIGNLCFGHMAFPFFFQLINDLFQLLPVSDSLYLSTFCTWCYSWSLQCKLYLEGHTPTLSARTDGANM